MDSSAGPVHPSVASSSLAVGRIGKEAIERATNSGKGSWWGKIFGASGKARLQEGGDGKKVMFLVCGPDPYVTHALVFGRDANGTISFPHDRMVAAIAGPYGRNFSQGEVGGALGEMGYGGDSVWKL